ncbi:MAG: hypothetical protein M1819_006995 [Sarea resinae]|nr:MAG: hypothetical protein M1819_006995 [Sarea resinae]
MSANNLNRALHEQFELLKGTENHKNDLIEELLYRLDTLSEEYQTVQLENAREKRYNRDSQLRELRLEEELRKLRALMDRNPFVLVLIDGDGLIFDDDHLRNAEQGGKDAAGLLNNAVRDYLETNLPRLSSDVKIIVRIYANIKGLAETCFKAGLVERPSKVEEFAKGFTGSKQLFDFVDVGSGKDRADDKLAEVFKLNLNDCHCRQIILGCSTDNGYARLLEEFATDRDLVEKITLLEGPPFERELVTLRNIYKSTKFNGLFRTSKINVYQPQQSQLASPPGILRSVSNIMPSLPPPPSTWASAAMQAPAYVASPPATPQPTTQGVPRNKYGERVDPEPKYDRNDVKRIKSLKLCNVHHLRGDCPYGDECSHDHTYKLTKSELETLKYIARLAPCRYGKECDDPECIYGHRCPLGKPGSRDCIFGDKCRFPEELHGVDTNVVRLLKV